MRDRRPLAVALMGPTASGKTALAVQWAQRFGGEIVSVDSALVYRRMDIGSAKPDAATLALAPHHLLDLREPLTSVSKAIGTSNEARNIPTTFAFDQPGLGVGRMYPYVDDAGFGSSGPKQAKPMAERFPNLFSASLKNVAMRPIVSPGVVVSMRVSARMLFGSAPTAQMNFVPPPSMPPKILSAMFPRPIV